MANISRFIALGLVSVFLSAPLFAASQETKSSVRILPNVIVLNPDGMSVAGTT